MVYLGVDGLLFGSTLLAAGPALTNPQVQGCSASKLDGNTEYYKMILRTKYPLIHTLFLNFAFDPVFHA